MFGTSYTVDLSARYVRLNPFETSRNREYRNLSNIFIASKGNKTTMILDVVCVDYLDKNDMIWLNLT